MKLYKGQVLSEGVAIGNIYIPEEIKSRKSLGKKREKEKLLAAIDKALLQIENLKNDNKENVEYLNIQKLLIEDYTLKDQALKHIDEGLNANESIELVLNKYALELTNCHNSYLQERASDILDIKHRILENMSRHKKYLEEPFILYSKNLRPSFIIQNKKNILGVITINGGYSSHGAILCRQLNIPYMIANIHSIESCLAILDTRKQQIILNPEQQDIEHYEYVLKELAKEEFEALEHAPFGFYANVSDNLELDRVLSYKFDGIGLYRTEFIFMNDDRPYSFEEQFEIYHEAVLKLKDKPICFRTFDIGDDKKLSYIDSSTKGSENYINNPLLFETQIKALLKANDYDNMKIMFPMITSYTEFVFLKNWVNRIKEEVCPNSVIKIGMMLETKEAINHLNEFKDVDFMSIGTNDLVLSIYHIERDNQQQKLQKYLNQLIEDLSTVVAYCEREQIELSICGELAAIGPALREFIRIGVKNFSVATPAIRILNKIYKEF